MSSTPVFSPPLASGSLRAARIAQSYEPGLLALSMWIRAFFVGVSLAVAGVASMFQPDVHLVAVTVMTLIGIALAGVSLSRTQEALRANTAP